MCFGIRDVDRLRELRDTYAGDDRMLSYIEKEARWTLGDAYIPAEFDRPVVEPDRVVPAFGDKQRVAA